MLKDRTQIKSLSKFSVGWETRFKNFQVNNLWQCKDKIFCEIFQWRNCECQMTICFSECTVLLLQLLTLSVQKLNVSVMKCSHLRYSCNVFFFKVKYLKASIQETFPSLRT